MLEDIYDFHEGSLRRLARSVSRNAAEADDLMQETFLRALSHSDLLQTLSPLQQRAWLSSVLRNCMVDLRRMERRECLVSEPEDVPAESGIDGELEAMDWLARLPLGMRDVVFKRYWLGMTGREISVSLGIPDGTVRYRLHMAVTMLRKWHKDEKGENDEQSRR